MSRIAFVATLLVLSACGGDPPPSASEPAAPAEEASFSETEATADTEFSAPRISYGVLLNVSQGDRACYLTLGEDTGEELDVMGAEIDVMASFDLCGPTDLIGQRVRLTYEQAEVMAMSCEGDPSCPDTETVELVMAMERDE